VQGSDFNVCGRKIFMNGANTPWHRWNDFGGGYDSAWWSDHYATLREAGINSSRVWITCNGEVGIDIAEDGTVLGATPEHWEHLDDFFAIAEEQQIYVMATLMSFDHFEDRNASRWRAWLASDEAIDSYVENYVRPFLERYGDNPYLWSIDLINEPDWVHERLGVSFDRLRAYFARAARAIHAESEVLVTVGMGSPKYNARCVGCQNEISDALLREALDDPDVYLDFYSPHYYDWVGREWGNSGVTRSTNPPTLQASRATSRSCTASTPRTAPWWTPMTPARDIRSPKTSKPRFRTAGTARCRGRATVWTETGDLPK
jgi:hypothetical protein